MVWLFIITLLLPFFIYFMIIWIVEGRWKCLFVRHQYIYWGEKHGMVRDTRTNYIIGTNRKVYCCTICGKEKPREKKDYD